MKKGDFLTLLENVEAQLPVLIQNPDAWQSLDVDYEPPRVERLWLQLGENRVYLHRIHPCEKALYHPHPWPSAIKILSGAYEMGVGYGTSVEPFEAATLLLTAGSSYEMIEPNGWHYVRPYGQPSLSIMVTGKPWPHRHSGVAEPKVELKPLDHFGKMDLITTFRRVYSHPTKDL